MKKFMFFAFLFMFSGLCYAEDIFIANEIIGLNDGSSCANARGILWLNTSTNWATGLDKVSPGDTVHLCGVITSPISVQGNGSAGNNITIKFESGAKLSKDTWGEGGHAITINGKSYIVVDGGINGIIEATNNGTALAYQTYNLHGVYTSSASNVEIKNLTINNLFVRTPGSSSIFGANGVRLEGTSTNISVHNNTCNYMNSCVYLAYGGSSDNVLIYNNTFNHGANGMVVGNNGASTLTNLQMYNNIINLYDDGSDPACGNTFHNDGLQFFAQTAGSSIVDMRVYGNTIGPNMGTCTATTGWIFIEGSITGSKVYNNLLLAGAGVKTPTNGFIYDKGWSGGTKATEVYNNTIVSDSQGSIGVNSGEEGVTIKNNIFMNLNYGVWPATNLTATNTDYNLYYNNNSNGHTDTHGVTANPNLDGNYIPQAGSPAIDAGISISSVFTKDKNGTARGVAWDIGAYEVDSNMKYPNSPSIGIIR